MRSAGLRKNQPFEPLSGAMGGRGSAESWKGEGVTDQSKESWTMETPLARPLLLYLYPLLLLMLVIVAGAQRGKTYILQQCFTMGN